MTSSERLDAVRRDSSRSVSPPPDSRGIIVARSGSPIPSPGYQSIRSTTEAVRGPEDCVPGTPSPGYQPVRSIEHERARHEPEVLVSGTTTPDTQSLRSAQHGGTRPTDHRTIAATEERHAAPDHRTTVRANAAGTPVSVSSDERPQECQSVSSTDSEQNSKSRGPVIVNEELTNPGALPTMQLKTESSGDPVIQSETFRITAPPSVGTADLNSGAIRDLLSRPNGQNMTIGQADTPTESLSLSDSDVHLPPIENLNKKRLRGDDAADPDTSQWLENAMEASMSLASAGPIEGPQPLQDVSHLDQTILVQPSPPKQRLLTSHRSDPSPIRPLSVPFTVQNSEAVPMESQPAEPPERIISLDDPRVIK